MCDDREKLIAYVYDDCDDAERRDVDAHLASCDACRSEVGGLRRVRQDLLAWDVPEHGSVWRPFVPARVAFAWRDVPAWALAAAASLLLLAGASGGLVTYALVAPQQERVVVVPPADPTPVREFPAELSGLEDRLLAALRAEMEERLQTVAADLPQSRVSGPPADLTDQLSALRAAQFDYLRAVNADIRTLSSRTAHLEQREQTTNMMLTSLFTQRGQPVMLPVGQ